jgi:hypothetical protein
MTVLAQTEDYLVEFEDGLLTIARYSDGHCKATDYRGCAGDFRRDLNVAGPEKALRTWVNGIMYRCQWRPLYKPTRMPGAPAVLHDQPTHQR